MNLIQSQLLINQQELDEKSKENRSNIHDLFIKNLLFIKVDTLTDFINKNYAIKVFGLPNNEILEFLLPVLNKTGFNKTECPFTFEKKNKLTEVVHLRIDDFSKELYLDFYTY